MGVSQAGTRPPAKSYGGKIFCACAVRASSLQLVGSVGERLPPTQPHHLFTSVPWFFRGRDRCGRAAKGFTPLCSNYPQLAPGHTLWWVLGGGAPAHTSAKLHSISEEVRHASRNADSACPFLPSRQYKTGHAESAFRDACRTSSDSI